MQFGDLKLTLVNGGNFRLDGGAMHGVVPNTIWNRLVSCDDLNRVEYATNCLLIEGHGKRTLIETGNGDKFPAREREIYGIDHDESVEKNLRAHGVDAESIDYVVMTHLHFDHSGGTTKRTAAGGFAPVFARARHVIQRLEYEDATQLPFIMGYDLDVVGTLESKRRVLGRAIDERWLVVFGHDKDLSAGYLGYDAKGHITVVERAPIS